MSVMPPVVSFDDFRFMQEALLELCDRTARLEARTRLLEELLQREILAGERAARLHRTQIASLRQQIAILRREVHP